MTRTFRLIFVLILVLLMGATTLAGPMRLDEPSVSEPSSSAWTQKVDPWVLDTAVVETETEFLIFLTEQADLGRAAMLNGKLQKGAHVYDRLTATAQETQAPVIAALEGMGVSYRSYWAVNAIWVRGDASVIRALAQRSDVAHLYANPRVRAERPMVDEEALNRAIAAVASIEWNISKIQAPDVWAEGYTGQGVVIGGQDTGYDWDHPGLINQYRGWNGSSADHNYNWHDSVHVSGSSCGADSPEPCDDQGHGTHTMGTMVGNDMDPGDPSWPDGAENAVGVAPGARWIGCRNMNAGDGTPARYIECYQWFIAPTDLNNQNADPSKAPHVINNSWSCPPSEGCTDPNVMLTVVENIRAAGIVTVHSAANDGPSCSTVSDPAAIYDDSYTVGATTSTDAIASYSSRGPVTVDGSNRLKPDISAPGSNIRSTTRGGNYEGGWNGTSMAGPHVAGMVALLISAQPSLASDVDQIESIINLSAVPRTTTQGCGGDGPADVPNNVYGYGRIDAWAAYESLSAGPTPTPGPTATPTPTPEPGVMHVGDIAMSIQKSGPNYNGVAVVTILDASDAPVAGATVHGTFSGSTSGSVSGVTDANGQVTLTSSGLKDRDANWTLCVDDVTKDGGWTYDAGANVETCGSTGASPTPTPTPAPTLTPTPGPTIEPGVMHVDDIAMSSQRSGASYKARATVTVVDEGDAPVAGATVYGTFSGATGDNVSGVTDANGQVTLESSYLKKGGSWTFCVDDVVKSGWPYDAGANVETCDNIVAP